MLALVRMLVRVIRSKQMTSNTLWGFNFITVLSEQNSTLFFTVRIVHSAPMYIGVPPPLPPENNGCEKRDQLNFRRAKLVNGSAPVKWALIKYEADSSRSGGGVLCNANGYWSCWHSDREVWSERRNMLCRFRRMQRSVKSSMVKSKPSTVRRIAGMVEILVYFVLKSIIRKFLAKYNVKIIMFFVTMLSCTNISNILIYEILKWVVHTKICTNENYLSEWCDQEYKSGVILYCQNRVTGL